jgi:uncharacterized protein (DUF305 family)
MQLLCLRKSLFAFIVVAVASVTGNVLSACSTITQSQTLTNKVTEASNKQDTHDGMNHSGMNHSGMSHNMDLGPADADFDLRFIDGMVPHHEGGVVMAKEALQKSKRPEIKKLADTIIKSQDREIGQMKQWRQAWYPKAPTTLMAWHAQMNHMMPMSTEQIKSMRMDIDLGAADSQFDLRFLNAMIPHHEGAVVMGLDAVKKSKRPEIKKLAQTIISSQQAEIQQMKVWRQAWYKK